MEEEVLLDVACCPFAEADITPGTAEAGALANKEAQFLGTCCLGASLCNKAVVSS